MKRYDNSMRGNAYRPRAHVGANLPSSPRLFLPIFPGEEEAMEYPD
jgi:hypothetical protein